jgi:hypothetical protein
MFIVYKWAMEHLKPKDVILKTDGEIAGFYFCKDSPLCDKCSFILSQVASLSFPNWVTEEEVSYGSLMVAVNPDNPNLVREDVKVYLEGALNALSKRSITFLTSTEMAVEFNFLTRADFEVGFYMKVNLFFKGVLSNEMYQELGIHFFLNNMADKNVNAEFGTMPIIDGRYFRTRMSESKSLLISHDMPLFFLREFSFISELGVQPLFLTDIGKVKSVIFDWFVNYKKTTTLK